MKRNDAKFVMLVDTSNRYVAPIKLLQFATTDYSSSVTLGSVPVEWHIAGAGD